jgi:hypothetical protein
MMEFRKLPVLRGKGSPQVDFENDIIRDVVIVETGEAKGHGVWLDSRFTKDITKQGNSIDGVKSRFGHPNMCGNSLGDFIGVFKNFRDREIDGASQSIADLYLDRVADKSPKYDKSIIDYILNFASTNPNMFGNSIVFKGIEEERVVKENGEQKKKTYMVLKDSGFSASDIVDDPAATSGMFSEFNIANAVTEFVNNTEIDISQFDELMENAAFIKFTELLLKNPKISHRILNIVMNNSEIYNEFKSKINNKPIDIDKVIGMFNNQNQ